MVKLNLLGFLLVAVVFHSMYIYSIFDIYFKSPIVHGMHQHHVEAEPPAKRLFLIVGDGLRADKCFESHVPPFAPEGADLTPRPLAPFLRSRVLEAGTFGVSHTRMPTESRPGHVAMIAGLYEDVSAVTTGWKENPVNFDSVFNQSRHTWSWGSPDILRMFQDGATPGRVDAYMYTAESEDFTKDATSLDEWVFNGVKDFFAKAKTDENLNQELRQDKLVFFLHLLGLDMNGHAYRPYSQEYLNNIAFVDTGIKEIVKIVDEFYGNDDKTSWVFTADHGMSDFGSHGDGHPNNTRTPLITWGAGIAKPNVKNVNVIARGHADGFSHNWGLTHVPRFDVNQADIAALMAFLVGVNFPANSVGELPLDYLSVDKQMKAQAMYTNAKQILEMYNVKDEQKSKVTVNYTPFKPFSAVDSNIPTRLLRIKGLVQSGLYDNAILESLEIIKLGLDGLRYLQTYDWLLLRAIVTSGYLGWIAFAMTNVIGLHVVRNPAVSKRPSAGVGFFVAGLLALYAAFYLQEAPWTYYAYSVFPFIFWEEVWASRRTTYGGLVQLFKGRNNFKRAMTILFKTMSALAFLEALVFGYFQRLVFTGCFIIGIFWPMLYGSKFVLRNKGAIGIWAVCCAIMSTFTTLPVVKQESLLLINIGGVAMFFIGLFYIMFAESRTLPIIPKENMSLTLGITRFDQISKSIMGIQVGLVALTLYITNSTVQSLQAKEGLPIGNQQVGWLVLISSLCVPALNRFSPQKHFSHRLMVIFLTFCPTFIILSISYETIFYVTFNATMVVWVHLERQIYEHKQAKAAKIPGPTKISSSTEPESRFRTLILSDTRIALFFFFFIQAAFFGTGNVASLSAFSLDSVYRLIPVFNPFAMSALLLFKLLIPFAIISANLGILNRRLEIAPSALFMLVMGLSDVLTLNFFFMVKDEGSWLDIGTTISHFCIASLLCVFVAALEFLSEVFVSGVEVDDYDVNAKKQQQKHQQHQLDRKAANEEPKKDSQQQQQQRMLNNEQQQQQGLQVLQTGSNGKTDYSKSVKSFGRNSRRRR